MLDKGKLENPKIKVVWEDVAESFTQERIARIKSYFSKKYKSKNVTVVTKVVVSKNQTKLDSIDMADNILDTQYQKELVKDYIKTHDIKVEWDLLSKLDDRVNNEIDKSHQNTIRFRQWYIKRLEFSNYKSKRNSLTTTPSWDFYSKKGATLIKRELKQWIKINPTDYLFFDKNKNQLNQVNITHKFNKIFESYNKNVSILMSFRF